MSDNTKMREAMIAQDGAVWEKIGGAWSMYKPAQSVPVLGPPVAWLNECQLNLSHTVIPYASLNEPAPDRDWRISPLYKAPTNSIPAAELATLREKAAEADASR